MLIIKFRGTGKYHIIAASAYLFFMVLIIFMASVRLLADGHLIDAILLIFPFIFISENFLTTVEYLIKNKNKKQ